MGEVEELASRYRSWDTADLVRATTVEASTYTPDALALLRQELQSRVGASAVEPPPMFGAIGRDLRGVRGFLALMVFGIGLSSALTLYQGIVALSHNLFIALIDGSIAAYGALVCWLLLRIDPRAPRAATTWFILILVVNLSALAFTAFTGQVRWLGALRSSIYPIVWLSYLGQSERVKVTYGSPRPPPDLDSKVFD